MPGRAHETLVDALHDRPTLLAALVYALTGHTIAPDLEPVDSTIRFVKVDEVRPDILYESGPGWTITEVQNDIDPEKQRRWLLAAAVVERAIALTERLPLPLQKTQRDAILNLLSERMLAWLKEKAMNPKSRLSPAVLEFKAAIGGQYRAEGLAEGRAEGRAEGERKALLMLLDPVACRRRRRSGRPSRAARIRRCSIGGSCGP